MRRGIGQCKMVSPRWNEETCITTVRFQYRDGFPVYFSLPSSGIENGSYNKAVLAIFQVSFHLVYLNLGIAAASGIPFPDLLCQCIRREIDQFDSSDLTASGLSKLEGQLRSVNDYEVVAIAEILDVPVTWLLGKE